MSDTPDRPHTLIVTRTGGAAFALRRQYDPAHVHVVSYERSLMGHRFHAIWAEQPETERERRFLADEVELKRASPDVAITVATIDQLWDLKLPRRAATSQEARSA